MISICKVYRKKILLFITKCFRKVTPSKAMKVFCERNKSNWQESLADKADINLGTILVDGIMNNPHYQLKSARIAKVLEKKYGLKPVILCGGLWFAPHLKVYQSYSVEYFEKLIIYNPLKLLKILYSSIVLFFNCKNADDLLSIKYKRVNIGDLIYDHIVRHHSDANYTINKIRFSYIKILFLALLRSYQCERTLSKYSLAKYVVVSHKVYCNSGIFARICHSRGLNIIVVDSGNVAVYEPNHSIQEHILTPSKQSISKTEEESLDHVISESERLLSLRFSGLIEQHDVKNAYLNKFYYSKEDLCSYYNIKADKSNIFIFPHVFSDAPHCGRYQLFRDYYQWLICTLEIIQNITDVNWFIKPHPSAHIYGERGVVEDIVYNMTARCNNIFLTPNDLHTASIAAIADVTITVQGTASLELSCMGIPAIITGTAPYRGQGFTYEPKSKYEYKQLLQNASHIPRLTEEQSRDAKVMFSLISNCKVKDNILPVRMLNPGVKGIKRYRLYDAIYHEASKKAMAYSDEFYETINQII